MYVRNGEMIFILDPQSVSIVDTLQVSLIIPASLVCMPLYNSLP